MIGAVGYCCYEKPSQHSYVAFHKTACPNLASTPKELNPWVRFPDIDGECK